MQLPNTLQRKQLQKEEKLEQVANKKKRKGNYCLPQYTEGRTAKLKLGHIYKYYIKRRCEGKKKGEQEGKKARAV